MALTWLSMGLLGEHRYQPRHRSTGRTGNGFEKPDPYWFAISSEPGSRPATVGSSAERFEVDADHPSQDFLDQMAMGEIRRILEGCALDDPTTVVPDLVQLIAHSSHTPATLANAWSQFEEASRDVYALHLRIRDWSALFRRDEHDEAVALMLSYADEAWRMITLGPQAASAQAPAEDIR
jgi:hypothetical protein